MAITVIVELQARPGQRASLMALLDRIVADQGPAASGFVGSTRYEVADDPDRLIEVAEWASVEARATHMQHAASTGAYAPLSELLAAPFRVTVMRRLTDSAKA